MRVGKNAKIGEQWALEIASRNAQDESAVRVRRQAARIGPRHELEIVRRGVKKRRRHIDCRRRSPLAQMAGASIETIEKRRWKAVERVNEKAGRRREQENKCEPRAFAQILRLTTAARALGAQNARHNDGKIGGRECGKNAAEQSIAEFSPQHERLAPIIFAIVCKLCVRTFKLRRLLTRFAVVLFVQNMWPQWHFEMRQLADQREPVAVAAKQPALIDGALKYTCYFGRFCERLKNVTTRRLSSL